MVLKLALTGNIASGKSEVEKIFNRLNISTICADRISHDVSDNNSVVKKQIIELFHPNDVYNKNGLNRQMVRKIIFEDKSKKLALEKIIHPIVISQINDFFEQEKNKKFAVAVVPLLFECEMEKLFEKIILVSADEKTRFNRIKKRNNFDDILIKNIINSQMKESEKTAKADFVIYNNYNTPLEDLSQQVKNVISELSSKI